jgi:hypothetical protein
MSKAAAKKHEESPAKTTRKRREAPPRAESLEEPAAVWVAIEELLPWVRNPRINDEAAKRVAESILEYGFGAPIVARRANNEVMAGHTRLKGARIAGLTHVPVRYLSLSEEKAHMYSLADNKLGELAEWERLGLAEILGELGERNAAASGWDASEFAKLINPPTPPEAFPEIDPDALTEHQCPKCGYEWNGPSKPRGSSGEAA